MKKSCFLLLAALIAGFVGYYFLLRGTELDGKLWIPGLFGLGVALIFGNLQGLFLAISQRSASSKPQNQWRDGDFVAVSGRIQTLRSPIVAPFSGEAAAIVEYDVKTGGDSQGTSKSIGDYSGFLMAPCAIQTMQGSVRVVGYPLLTDLPEDIYDDEASFLRAAEYLSKCNFKEKASNPLTLLKQLNEVLEDDDGDLKVDFCAKGATIHIQGALPEITKPMVSPDDDESDEDDGEGDDREYASLSPNERIAARLADSGYFLEETIIKNGAEVTAFGTYRLNKQAVDVGSGLKNISHTLKLGTVASVTGKTIRQSLIGLVIFGGMFLAGNWYVLRLIGIEILK